MTTSNLMSLPVDIAWKRLALDDEMMWLVPTPGHFSIYPARWNPSVTIFYAHPDPDSLPLEYQDTLITYLKVVCSVTGTTPAPGDLFQGKPWPADDPAAKIIAANLAQYYGCYGALLEVDAVPYDADGVPAVEYPYFLDFEPKKRELYEAVTKSGETLSDSKDTLSVRKSTTSVASQERARGVIPAAVPEFKSEAKDEYNNVRNIDASRELRETVSHTTQLTQMYHLLEAYHLGTNRALFFLQPRPHNADPDYQSFLEGPRRLEGIQEFFLVVAQPKTRPGLCVSAGLSTGHFAFGKTAGSELGPQFKSFSVNQSYVYAPTISVPTTKTVYSDPKRFEIGKELWPPNLPLAKNTEVWIDEDVNKGATRTWKDAKGESPPVLKGPGWTLTLDEANCKYLSEVQDILVISDASGLTIETQMKATKVGEVSTWSGRMDLTELGKVQATLTVALKVKLADTTWVDGRDTIDFFVRSKTVGACLDEQGRICPRQTSTRFQTAEVGRYQGPFGRVGSSNGAAGQLGALRALNDRIAEAMRDVNDVSIYKRGPGPVSNPFHTDYVLQRLRDGLPLVADRRWLDTPISRLAAIPEDMKRYLVELQIQDRRQLLETPLERLRDGLRRAGLEINEIQVRDLYLTAWGIVARDNGYQGPPR